MVIRPDSIIPLIITAIIVLPILAYGLLTEDMLLCDDLPASEKQNLTDEDAKFTLSEAVDLFEVIKEEKSIYVNTIGDSMLPTINSNQRCICEVEEKYHVGQVIVFIKNGIGISHRIVYESDGNYVTKGDSNSFLDIPVKQEEVLCKIATRRRFK